MTENKSNTFPLTWILYRNHFESRCPVLADNRNSLKCLDLRAYLPSAALMAKKFPIAATPKKWTSFSQKRNLLWNEILRVSKEESERKSFAQMEIVSFFQDLNFLQPAFTCYNAHRFRRSPWNTLIFLDAITRSRSSTLISSTFIFCEIFGSLCVSKLRKLFLKKARCW